MARLSLSALIDGLSGGINKVQKDGQDTSGADVEWRQLDNGDVVQATKGGKISESEKDRLPQQEAWCKCDVRYRQLSDSEKDDLRDRARRINWDGSIYQLFMRDCINEELKPAPENSIDISVDVRNQTVFQTSLSFDSSPYWVSDNVFAAFFEGNPILELRATAPTAAAEPYLFAQAPAVTPEAVYPSFPYISMQPPDDLPDRVFPSLDSPDPLDNIREDGSILSANIRALDEADFSNIAAAYSDARVFGSPPSFAILPAPAEEGTCIAWSTGTLHYFGERTVQEVNDGFVSVIELLRDALNPAPSYPSFRLESRQQVTSLGVNRSEFLGNLDTNRLQATPPDMPIYIYFPERPTDRPMHISIWEGGQINIFGAVRERDAIPATEDLIEDAGLS